MSNRSKPRVRFAFDESKERFPDKAFAVANDGCLLKWNDAGTAVYADDTDFEKLIMKYYPGFLQIPSFVNFRRLFREYGFDWEILEETNFLQFSHPFFIRGKPELLPNVLTKRKSFGFSPRELSRKEQTNNTSTPRRKYKRLSAVTKLVYKDNFTFDDSDCDSSNTSGHKRFRVDADSSSHDSETRLIADSRVENNRGDVNEIMQEFARNEMTEDEYYLWIAQKEKQGKHAWDILFPKSGHERLYTSGSTESSVGIHGNDAALTAAHHDIPVAFVPCGSCICCKAYHSYGVHINPAVVQYNSANVQVEPPSVSFDPPVVYVDPSISESVQISPVNVQVGVQTNRQTNCSQVRVNPATSVQVYPVGVQGYQNSVQVNPANVQVNSPSNHVVPKSGHFDYRPDGHCFKTDVQLTKSLVDHAYTTYTTYTDSVPTSEIGGGDSAARQFAVL